MAHEKLTYVIFGLGRFGTALTKALHTANAEVLVIDRDEEKINDISPYCTHAVCADATDENSMSRLGLNNFDVAIICVATDVESSIFTTLMCKQMGIKKVIAKAADRKHKLVLEKIGADMVIVPEEAMGEKLAAMLLKPNMIEVLNLTENFRMVEIRPLKKWLNHSLAQLNLRNTERISIILIKRGNDVIVTPGADCVLLEGDIIVVAGTLADTKRLSNKATETVNAEIDMTII